MQTNTKTYSPKTLVVLASLSLGLGALAVHYATTAADAKDTDAQGSAAASSDLARRSVSGRGADADQGPCSFSVGTRMAYEVDTQSNTKLDMGTLMEGVRVGGQSGMKASATAMDQQASRHWHVDLEAIARGNDGSTVVAAHIEAQDTQIAGQGTQKPAPALADTFLVRMDPQCSIREFGWRTDGDRGAARDQQQLLAGLAWLAPREGERSSAGTLFDPIGRYHAAFTTQDEGFTGHVVDYPQPFGKATRGMPAPTFDVEASAIEVEPRAGEWFASLSNTRALTMTVHGLNIGHIEGSVVAQRAEPGSWRPQVSLDDGGWSWGLLLGQPTPHESAEVRARKALVGVAVQDAVSHYLALVHEGRSSAETVAYLTAWLRSNPEATGELVAMLRAGAFEGEQSGSAGLFLALGTANTPQAADALVGIVEGPGDSLAHKISAAHAMSKVESPTEAMVDAVAMLVEQGDIHPVERSSLAMTLGIFASHNAERSPELAAKAREQIEGWLANPGDTQDLAGSLLAAGNAGHDGLVGAIEPYFEHDDPQIRQRANLRVPADRDHRNRSIVIS